MSFFQQTQERSHILMAPHIPVITKEDRQQQILINKLFFVCCS